MPLLNKSSTAALLINYFSTMGCQAVKNLKFILDKTKLTLLYLMTPQRQHCGDMTC